MGFGPLYTSHGPRKRFPHVRCQVLACFSGRYRTYSAAAGSLFASFGKGVAHKEVSFYATNDRALILFNQLDLVLETACTGSKPAVTYRPDVMEDKLHGDRVDLFQHRPPCRNQDPFVF